MKDSKQDSCNVLTNLIWQDFTPLGHTSHEQSPKSNLKGDLSEDNGLKLKYCVWTTQLQRLSLGVLRSHLIRVSFIWFQRIVCVCAAYFKQQHNRIIQHMLRIFSGDLAFLDTVVVTCTFSYCAEIVFPRVIYFYKTEILGRLFHLSTCL